ncbi:hypothetical protein M758_UG279800 [Ceratodon purpureus]|nr:hypothetical protein M758_UG279800 [Ceratodon purpureus]
MSWAARGVPALPRALSPELRRLLCPVHLAPPRSSAICNYITAERETPPPVDPPTVEVSDGYWLRLKARLKAVGQVCSSREDKITLHIVQRHCPRSIATSL